MTKAARYVIGEHPQLGRLWAAIDPAAHHVEGRVAERRFSAFLAPFKSHEEAVAALLAAGASVRKEAA